MKLDIFNIDEFIKRNDCPQVTNPICWNYDQTPTTDGLFSYELFGLSDEERKSIFGYIDLKGHYLHPLIWLMINKRMGSIGAVTRGEKYAVIADKKIKIVSEDTPGAETGLQFLYDNFYKINWIDELEEDEIESIDKKTRLKFLKSLERDEAFVSKWLVLPPFYRAESLSNRSMGDSINKLYKELLSKVKGISLGFSFDIYGSATKLRIQNILKDLYLSTTTPISGKSLVLEKGRTEGELKGSGKNSMVRKHLLGKTIDWSASNVITSPQNSRAEKLSEKPVPFGQSAFPIATLLSMFQPFYMQYCSDLLESALTQFANKFMNKIKHIDIGQFNSEKIEKMIKSFIYSPEERFAPIIVEFTDLDNKKRSIKLDIYEFHNENDVKKKQNYIRRPMTLTDLMYQASVVTLSDKHVYVTRYPIANIQNIFPTKVKILSTAKTRKTWITLFPDGEVTDIFEDDNYPVIPAVDKKPGIDNAFYDVMLCGNAYLESLGGDYDGDMLYMRAVFSQEANAEAEKLIWAKTNMLNADGSPSRGLSAIGKECVMGLYELTKDVD